MSKFIASVDEDVLTASATDLMADTGRPGSFKVEEIIDLEIVATGGGVQNYVVTEAHGLGFIPTFVAIVHATGENSSRGEPIWYKIPFYNLGLRIMKVAADETYIYATAVSSETTTYSFKVMVFREDLEGPFFNIITPEEI